MRKKMNEVLKSGLIAGIFSGSISCLLNYYLLPVPATTLDNAIGHGIGGFICGAVSASIGALLCMMHFGLKKSEPLT